VLDSFDWLKFISAVLSIFKFRLYNCNTFKWLRAMTNQSFLFGQSLWTVVLHAFCCWPFFNILQLHAVFKILVKWYLFCITAVHTEPFNTNFFFSTTAIEMLLLVLAYLQYHWCSFFVLWHFQNVKNQHWYTEFN